jgi:hypothetical protein
MKYKNYTLVKIEFNAPSTYNVLYYYQIIDFHGNHVKSTINCHYAGEALNLAKCAVDHLERITAKANENNARQNWIDAAQNLQFAILQRDTAFSKFIEAQNARILLDKTSAV